MWVLLLHIQAARVVSWLICLFPDVYGSLFSCTDNFNIIYDFAIEDCVKWRDTEKVKLSSKFKNVGGRFDLHLSVFALPDMAQDEKKVSITCFKIERTAEEGASSSASKRPRTSQ